MSTRSVRLRNLMGLVAFFASLAVLGCWDNRREIARVLEQGYVTEVQITGAQFQRLVPFAVDGWRPRLVEQALSVDVQWLGKDGKTHVHRKVPVSERLERSIVNGEQVKLIAVPAKVLDDDTSVPVLTFDAAARLESLDEWLAVTGYLAALGWIGVAAMTLWQRRRVRQPVTGRAASGPVNIPSERLLIGIVALCVGLFLTVRTWTSYEGTGPGGSATVEVDAEIVNVSGPPYAVQLGWKDGQGGVHHYGPLPVSEAFRNKITRDGNLIVHETRVRLSNDAAMVHPVILDDPPAMPWRGKAILAAGLALTALGAGFLLSVARILRRG